MKSIKKFTGVSGNSSLVNPKENMKLRPARLADDALHNVVTPNTTRNSKTGQNRMQRDALAQMLVHPFLDIILNAKIKRYSYILQRLIVSECKLY